MSLEGVERDSFPVEYLSGKRDGASTILCHECSRTKKKQLLGTVWEIQVFFLPNRGNRNSDPEDNDLLDGDSSHIWSEINLIEKRMNHSFSAAPSHRSLECSPEAGAPKAESLRCLRDKLQQSVPLVEFRAEYCLCTKRRGFQGRDRLRPPPRMNPNEEQFSPNPNPKPSRSKAFKSKCGTKAASRHNGFIGFHRGAPSAIAAVSVLRSSEDLGMVGERRGWGGGVLILMRHSRPETRFVPSASPRVLSVCLRVEDPQTPRTCSPLAGASCSSLPLEIWPRLVILNNLSCPPQVLTG